MGISDKIQSRNKAYRIFKKMKQAVEVLHEMGKLDDAQKVLWLGHCDEIYAAWRQKICDARRPTHKRRGRKQIYFPRHTISPTCKRPGCAKPSAPEQVYCSKDCAPLGNFGRGWAKE